jgi:hypothetical protein
MVDLGTVDTTVGIFDGRIAMSADGDAHLYVDVPDHRPLSTSERHATLRLEGDDYRAEVTLDGEDLDAVMDALHQAREAHDA